MRAENPYKPPAAAVRDPARPPRPPRSQVVAVLAGLGVDIGGSLVVGIVIGIVQAATLSARGMDPRQIQTEMTELDPSSAYFFLNSLVGLGFSMLGGYVCARMARRDERRLTAIMAGVNSVLGLSLGGLRLGVALNVLMIVLTFASTMSGGQLGRRRNLADARETGAATAA
jgi:hypothetical protein